jgi:hypothetical protein
MHFALLLAVVCVAMVGILVVAGPERKASWAKHGGPVRYSLRSLMTAREREFIRLLRLALPNAEIHAQVAMGALVEVVGGGRAARNRFDRKVLDYVVCSSAGTVLYAIELDDRSHLSESAKKRDAVKNEVCAAAGLRLVRYSSLKVHASVLRSDFEHAMLLKSQAAGSVRPNVGSGASSSAAI